jgi:hypothetical protein
MAKQKADFEVKDIIVQVVCPVCRSRQYSPGYKDSLGWDAKDLRKVGGRGQVKCLNCGATFGLPAKLFQLTAGILTPPRMRDSRFI